MPKKIPKKRKPLKEKPEPEVTISKGGRPPLSEATKLSPDMKEVAILSANGYDPGEIAEKMGTTGSRILEILKNPLVKKRILKERKDFVGEWSNMREEILSETYQAWLGLLRNGKAKAGDFRWLLDRLEEQEGIYVSEKETKVGSPVKRSPNVKKDPSDETESMEQIMDGITE